VADVTSAFGGKMKDEGGRERGMRDKGEGGVRKENKGEKRRN